MERESIVFYRSFYEAIEQLADAETKAQTYKAVFEYGLNGNEIELTGIAGALFTAFKPQIDANTKRYINGLKGAEFGKLGGRPKKGTGETEETPKKPQENPKETPPKEKKSTYGEHKHVRLTATEYDRLIADYGEQETAAAIQFFDDYIEDKGYKSKSHNMAMRRWVFDAVKERKAKVRPISNKFNSMMQNSYTSSEMSELERQLLDN